jgi:hypothetical protein
VQRFAISTFQPAIGLDALGLGADIQPGHPALLRLCEWACSLSLAPVPLRT